MVSKNFSVIASCSPIDKCSPTLTHWVSRLSHWYSAIWIYDVQEFCLFVLVIILVFLSILGLWLVLYHPFWKIHLFFPQIFLPLHSLSFFPSDIPVIPMLCLWKLPHSSQMFFFVFFFFSLSLLILFCDVYIASLSSPWILFSALLYEPIKGITHFCCNVFDF